MTGSLEIIRVEFAEAFRQLRRLCLPRTDGEAVLSYDGTCLHIEVGEAHVAPKAAGSWPGRVRVRNDFILSFGKLLPSGSRIHVQFENGQLHIGSSSTPCIWQAPYRPKKRMIEMPSQATVMDYLMLTYRHSGEDIEESGLTEAVASAQGWLDRQLELATGELKEFGIMEHELRALVLSRLKTQA